MKIVRREDFMYKVHQGNILYSEVRKDDNLLGLKKATKLDECTYMKKSLLMDHDYYDTIYEAKQDKNKEVSLDIDDYKTHRNMMDDRFYAIYEKEDILKLIKELQELL